MQQVNPAQRYANAGGGQAQAGAISGRRNGDAHADTAAARAGEGRHLSATASMLDLSVTSASPCVSRSSCRPTPASPVRPRSHPPSPHLQRHREPTVPHPPSHTRPPTPLFTHTSPHTPLHTHVPHTTLHIHIPPHPSSHTRPLTPLFTHTSPHTTLHTHIPPHPPSHTSPHATLHAHVPPHTHPSPEP